MSHKKVFEDVVNNALRMPDDNQAINFACIHLECMYQFISSQSEVKSMCALAVDKFYNNKRFRGNDHVLRIFQVLIRVSQNMGATGIYSQIDSSGYFRNSLKFYLLWGEAEAAQKNSVKFKDIWTQARQYIPSKNLDAAFRDIASLEFPEITSWFEDDDHERTLDILNDSRRKVDRFEREAVPVSSAPSTPSIKTSIFMSKKNPLRTCIVDRNDGYLGISPEEYRLAKTDDLADMEITMMQPIEEEPEMDIQTEKEENVETKKMRIYSPLRQPLIQKQDTKAPSPLIAHTLSETMKVEEVVNSPMDKRDSPTLVLDGDETIVAGHDSGKGSQFLTSTPRKASNMENAEPNFWQDRVSGEGLGLELEDLNLSHGEGEKGGEKGESTQVAPKLCTSGSAFARKRKSFGGAVGDKARSSIGPKGGAEKEIEKGQT